MQHGGFAKDRRKPALRARADHQHVGVPLRSLGQNALLWVSCPILGLRLVAVSPAINGRVREHPLRLILRMLANDNPQDGVWPELGMHELLHRFGGLHRTAIGHQDATNGAEPTGSSDQRPDASLDQLPQESCRFYVRTVEHVVLEHASQSEDGQVVIASILDHQVEGAPLLAINRDGDALICAAPLQRFQSLFNLFASDFQTMFAQIGRRGCAPPMGRGQRD